ncbi:hypothetical protein [Halococcus sediminicola]|uniref:hypothetical protein n=1 Tax=Halococcus sediminicola TaxID=1264579 RepID=UPI000678E334|nr:hypothetical protein [Halococcus sediminicola]
MTRSPPDRSLTDLADLVAEHFSDRRHSDGFSELSLVIDNSDREHSTLIIHCPIAIVVLSAPAEGSSPMAG